MSRKRSNNSSAVKQQRAAKEQVADTPEQSLYRILNFFPTPPWAGRAGAEILKEMDPTARVIREPACGQGHMATALAEYFPMVIASDIHNFGYGAVQDFLLDGENEPEFDWLMTNPPFDQAEKFLEKGLRLARRGVGLLCRIAFLEGAARFPVLFRGENPLTLCAVFAERLPIVLGQYDPDASSAACYAWFFFQKGVGGNGGPRLTAIPPGTQARLFQHEDVRRFAKLAPAPLLAAVE